MIWLWIYLAQAVIVSVIATRICFRLRESYEGAGDSLTMGVMIGFFWPPMAVIFLALGGIHLFFEGLGRLVTIGSKGRVQ